ncbi:MAG: hypothetical protein EOO90_11425 [Pedobacter sp.]|nr:MAG: hypothetical protein EOO90_11425 [Pedobacter sp.]
MKLLKPILVIFTFLALTYSVSANKTSGTTSTSILPVAKQVKSNEGALPVNNVLLFAFSAIATMGGYMFFKSR